MGEQGFCRAELNLADRSGYSTFLLSCLFSHNTESPKLSFAEINL